MMASTLKDKLKQAGIKPAGTTRSEPLWKGPEVDGVTFSMLTRFLSCRERFRVTTVLGLRPNEGFNHKIEYGQMWHVCEEAHAANIEWRDFLFGYSKKLCEEFPLQQAQIDHWYQVCLVQFPIYVEYWERNNEVVERTPLVQEKVFEVPYKLFNGRTVILRGKWDSVDLIGKGKPAGIYLQENKTKGDIDEYQMQRQLSFDLQTMLYLVTMKEQQKVGNLPNTHPVKGVRYNVVRRPLSGGRGSIVRHKGSKNKPEETQAAYYARLRGIIDGSTPDSPGPEYYFMRWKADIGTTDLDKFKRECITPLLTQLVDWYDWVVQGGKINPDPFAIEDNHIHWRHPFGSMNWLDEGGSSDLDEYLSTGSRVGLRQVEKLFTELT